MTRAAIAPGMIRWARERAGRSVETLTGQFPKLALWEAGEVAPTLKQLDAFAKAAHVPVGYLFLPEPPVEPLPIPDFRTLDGRAIRQASPDLLETLYACQERQSWYQDFARTLRLPEVPFIGSASLSEPPAEAAARIAAAMGLDLAARTAAASWEEALRLLVRQIEQAGVLVMINGVVLSNNARKLDPEEFRGFALADRQAPLIFVNGADSKSGQMFTLAHELAHLWLGATAVSDASAAPLHGHRREEVWCNAVAAELLVPLVALRGHLIAEEGVWNAVPRLGRIFKVSSLVILRRLLDVGFLSRTAFDGAWREEMARLRALADKSSGGGNFYRTTLTRVGRRFARALVESTLEGQTLYRDAFRMLGVSKTETFNTISRELGVTS